MALTLLKIVRLQFEPDENSERIGPVSRFQVQPHAIHPHKVN